MKPEIVIAFIHIFLLCAVFALAFSYYLMWRIEKKRHIFALFLFLITVFIFIEGDVNYLVFRDNYCADFCEAFILVKAILLAISSCLFLYSTWRKDLQ